MGLGAWGLGFGLDGHRPHHVAHQPTVALAHLARLDALAHERHECILPELLVRGRA